LHILAALVALFWFAVVYAGMAFGSAFSGVGLSLQRTIIAVLLPLIIVEGLILEGIRRTKSGQHSYIPLILAVTLALVHFLALRSGFL
jgi:nitrous oxidase accessory protein NosD